MIQKERLLSNFVVALESVMANKIRSFLTALGIIFGVAAVITMLAIGRGAEKEIMDQMELVGVNNISITSNIKQNEEQINHSKSGSAESIGQEELSPGLSLSDAINIESRVPGIQLMSPEIIITAKVIRKGFWRTTQLIGIENAFFEIFNFKVELGNKFNAEQLRNGLPVCIIGNEIRNKFINEENPIGQKIKCQGQWLTVIGVLENKTVSEKAKEQEELGIRDYNMDIYIPLQTMLIRYENRSLITQDVIVQKRNNKVVENYHQLDKLTIKIKNGYNLTEIAEIISKILKRKHLGNIDYSILIPELLLEQQQKSKKLFSLVLAVIAGISLLVGGIGIMNILLASVLERIREIGLRMALGAKQQDIVQQFLFEAVLIGVSGGIIGVLLGMLFSFLIQTITGINTIVTIFSILLSFFVAVSIGLIFGIVPARKAAQQDPISSLRHE